MSEQKSPMCLDNNGKWQVREQDMLLTQEDFKDADTHTLGLFFDTPKEILEAQVAKVKKKIVKAG